MKDKYNEVMEHIQITEDMRSRILRNVEESVDSSESHYSHSAETSPRSSDKETSHQETSQKETKGKILRFSSMKRWASIAAVLVLVIIGGSFYRLNNANTPSNDPAEVVTAGGIEEVSSRKELAKSVGFDVEELSWLPFEAQEVIYVAYDGELAESIYRDDEKYIIYRKSKGTEENSGDYSVYSQEQTFTLNNDTVSMRGENNAYTLAVWTDGEFSYSVLSSEGLSEDEMMQVILMIQ